MTKEFKPRELVDRLFPEPIRLIGAKRDYDGREMLAQFVMDHHRLLSIFPEEERPKILAEDIGYIRKHGSPIPTRDPKMDTFYLQVLEAYAEQYGD
jgi:hypothetical protein